VNEQEVAPRKLAAREQARSGQVLRVVEAAERLDRRGKRGRGEVHRDRADDHDEQVALDRVRGPSPAQPVERPQQHDGAPRHGEPQGQPRVLVGMARHQHAGVLGDEPETEHGGHGTADAVGQRQTLAERLPPPLWRVLRQPADAAGHEGPPDRRDDCRGDIEPAGGERDPVHPAASRRRGRQYDGRREQQPEQRARGEQRVLRRHPHRRRRVEQLDVARAGRLAAAQRTAPAQDDQCDDREERKGIDNHPVPEDGVQVVDVVERRVADDVNV
jgi:hypothetical protein